MPCLEKFSEKSIRALSSRNQTEEGVGLEEEVDAPKRKGFWDGVDLRLDAMMQLMRERERESEKQQQDNLYKNIET